MTACNFFSINDQITLENVLALASNARKAIVGRREPHAGDRVIQSITQTEK